MEDRREVEIWRKQKQRVKERSHNKQQRGHVMAPQPHNKLRHIYASGLSKATQSATALTGLSDEAGVTRNIPANLRSRLIALAWSRQS